jgi:hypothetical protein
MSMTPTDILQAAADERPDLIEKVAQAMFVLERISPEYAKELADDIVEITTYTHEKLSASASSLALGAAGALGIGLAGSVASDLYDAAKRGLTKGRNFNRMMASTPDLKNFDKKDLQNSFNTIHRFAPEMTADPILAANLVRGLAVSPENSVGFVKELLTSRKNLADSKGRQYSMGPLNPISSLMEEPRAGGRH